MAHTEQLAIPTYFAPGAFAMARVVAEAVTYDQQQLQRFSETAQEITGRGLPPLSEATFIFRYVQYGPEQPKLDPPLKDANPADKLYVPACELARPINEDPQPVSKAEVQHFRQPFEIRIRDFARPIMGEVAETLVCPPPEDLVMRPGKGTAHFLRAWGAQVGEAFGLSGVSEDKKNQLRREATRYFAGAIALQPREK